MYPSRHPGSNKSDPQWLLNMFDTYFEGLFLFAGNMVFRDDVANDIVQEVFITLYEKKGSFEDERMLKSYLYKSVRNRCYNYLRDRKVEDRRHTLYAEACLAAESTDMIEEEELLAGIRDYLRNLPEQCREVCRLRLFENLSYTEIASILEINENTVRVQLHRGIKKMHSHFSGQNFLLAVLAANINFPDF